MKIKKGDEVLVISGKDKGKIGKILRCFPKEGKVIVSGVNLVKKHLKPGPKRPKGEIVTVEAKIFVSKVKLICPYCKKPTRVGYSIKEDKEKVRICKKCKSEIP